MGVIIVVMTLGAAYAVLSQFDEVLRAWDTTLGWVMAHVAALAAFAVAALVAFVLAMVVRDALLRRRVRYVLKARATCPGCSYPLLGLSVSAAMTVDCPECGHHMQVDPALAELSREPSGAMRLNPKPEKRLLPWLTRRRVWIACRCVLALGVCVGLYFAVRWALVEFRVHADVRLARSDIHGTKLLQEYSETLAPPRDFGSTGNGRELFDRAVMLVRQAEQKVASAPDAVMEPDGSGASYPEYTRVGMPSDATNDEGRAWEDRTRTVALRVLAELKRNGGVDALCDMANSPVPPADWKMTSNRLDATIDLGDLGARRLLAKVSCALAMQALADGDQDGFVEHLQEAAWVVRMARAEPLLVNWLVANAVDAMVRSRITSALKGNPPAGLAERIHGGLARYLEGPSSNAPVFRGERLFSLETLARMYADIELVRRGGYTNTAGFSFNISIDAGKYSESRAEVERRFDAFIKQADVPRASRDLSCLGPPFETSFAPLFMTSYAPSLDSMDLHATARSALRTIIAIHRFKDATGQYPEYLADLVPGYLAALPMDPACNTRLRFKRIDPKADKYRRSYLLYSIGADGKDNHGLEIPNTYTSELIKVTTPGLERDVIFNSPDW